jgi:selenide,water dikinase
MTDVTGFGLLGHSLEVARGSALTIDIRASSVPLLSQAAELAKNGCVTGASHRNWASYQNGVRLPIGMPDWQLHLLTDPQTSGGLLVSCAADRAPGLLEELVNAGYPMARVIGEARQGPALVQVLE